MKKSKLYGLIGSAVSCIILFLILWFVILNVSTTTPPEEEGLMISFGETPDGSGMTETPADKPNQSSLPAAASKPAKQDLMTQKENSLAIAEQNERNKERQEQVTLENQRKEANRQAANQRRSEQAAINKANSMNGMFGNNHSTGSGTGTGNSTQGNPAGRGSSGGNSWSLNGRSLTGRLVSPNYDQDVEGKITVSIRVDQSGRVISASIGSPTTISDAQTRNAAIAAANSTHFSEGKGVSSGSITYKFKLR